MKKHRTTQAEKEWIRKLRWEGSTLDEIVLATKLKRRTVGDWIKKFPMSEAGKLRITNKRRQSSKKAAKVTHHKTSIRAKNFRKTICEATEAVPLTMLDICVASLYLGEGNKSRETWILINSDSAVIALGEKWLRVNNFDYRLSVQIYKNDKPKEQDIKEYWLRIAPKAKDCKIYYIPSRGKTKRRLPYGTARLAAKQGVAAFFTWKTQCSMLLKAFKISK